MFASRDAANWWRAITRAAERDRSVSFLTASGALRVADRAGAAVDESDLHAWLGSGGTITVDRTGGHPGAP